MFVFYKLLGKSLLAVLALVKLDALVFVFPLAALDHFSTLTIRATGGLSVRRLVLVLPKQAEVVAGLEVFGFGFVWHGVFVYITNWGREYHEFGREKARFGAHEFGLVLV
ncbi:MAG: hypothetical protein DRH24_20475 [Deltaproteobacteria bacterium]|nr:MAG: hypothetical protein DRH24_20475 [Deltaproteobacteria bacterium]